MFTGDLSRLRLLGLPPSVATCVRPRRSPTRSDLMPRYCTGMSTDVLLDLTQAAEFQCEAFVRIARCLDSREAVLHVELRGQSDSEFMRRLLHASIGPEGTRIDQEFDVWFRPEPACPDGLIVRVAVGRRVWG
jgi:hypothetical protein